MIRYLFRIILATAAVLLLPGVAGFSSHAAAQTSPGAICVSTYADTNGNGTRDAAEGVLPGVNVNLSTGGAIIATHITMPDEAQYCFENLLPGVYTLTFTDSPTYRSTTSNEGTFALDEGQRLTINGFGAVPVPLTDLRAEVAAQVVAAQTDDQPLETSTRLLIATAASMAVMLFMVGIGAVILGLLSGRRSRKPA